MANQWERKPPVECYGFLVEGIEQGIKCPYMCESLNKTMEFFKV